MSDEPIEIEGPPVPQPLGPGDDDPRSPAKGDAADVRGPLMPGESSGPNPDEDFHILIQAPAGQGEAATGPRQMTRFPKQKPPVAVAAVVNDEE